MESAAHISPASLAAICHSEDAVNRYAILANLPPEQILDVKALAICLSCSTRTIHRHIASHELPPPFKNGNKFLWKVKHILAWFDRLHEAAKTGVDREMARLASFEFRT